MAPSDSEDEFADAPGPIASQNVNALIEQCRNFVPQSNQSSYAEIRKKLVSLNCSDRQTRSVSQKSRTEVADVLRELSTDFTKISKKLDIIADSMLYLLDKSSENEQRIAHIEKNLSELSKKNKNPPSFANVVSAEQIKNSNDRLNKLEFQKSEDDRKNKLLEVSVTDPSLNSNSTSPRADVNNFFVHKMKMSPREIDQNFVVHKAKRTNSVIVQFSDRRYKLFLFKARSKLKQNDQNSVINMYLNDNLTGYNFEILKNAKKIRVLRKATNKPCFESVYTIDGRVFLKMKKDDSNDAAVHIKTNELLDQIVMKLDEPQAFSSAPSSSQI